MNGRLITSGLIALLLATALVGCLDTRPSNNNNPAPATTATILASLDASLVSGGGHDHAAFDQHNGTGWDLASTFQAPLPLGLDWPFERRALGQMQVIGNYAFVSLTLAGFTIIDISDPAAPRHVGVFDAGTSLLNDVEVTADLRWAFVPSDRSAVNTGAANTDTLDPLNLVAQPQPGILIVDLADLTQPLQAGMYLSPDSFGYHRLDLFDIDGVTHVFGATYSRSQQQPEGCRLDILRFDATAAGPILTKVGSYASTVPEHIVKCSDPQTEEVGGAHDVFVVPDPLEGFPLAVVSMWDTGVHLLDVSNPMQPTLLGYWDELPWYNGNQSAENLQSANAHESQVTAVEGRRIVAVAMERIWAQRQGNLWMVDFTDFQRPSLVSQWSLPGHHPHFEHQSDPFAMTSHGPKIFDGRIWLTHHHAGLIVLNITTMNQVRELPIEAWFIPPPSADRGWFGPWVASPMAYDVVVRDRDVFLSDITGGFHVARWTPGSGLWEQNRGPAA